MDQVFHDCGTVLVVVEGIDKITAQQQFEGGSPTLKIWHLPMQHLTSFGRIGVGLQVDNKEEVALQHLNSPLFFPQLLATALTKYNWLQLTKYNWLSC